MGAPEPASRGTESACPLHKAAVVASVRVVLHVHVQQTDVGRVTSQRHAKLLLYVLLAKQRSDCGRVGRITAIAATQTRADEPNVTVHPADRGHAMYVAAMPPRAPWHLSIWAQDCNCVRARARVCVWQGVASGIFGASCDPLRRNAAALSQAGACPCRNRLCSPCISISSSISSTLMSTSDNKSTTWLD